MAENEKEQGSMMSTDPFGIGMLANGKLNIVPPGELAARIALRDAEEALENEEPENSDGEAGTAKP